MVVLIFAGGLFESLGAVTAKAPFPQVEVKDLRTTRKLCVAERKGRVGTYVSTFVIGRKVMRSSLSKAVGPPIGKMPAHSCELTSDVIAERSSSKQDFSVRVGIG